MDFAALQQKLFDIEPTDRAEDLRQLAGSAGGMPQESVQTDNTLLQESVEIAEGTMPVEGNYSLSDFAKLAGVQLKEAKGDTWAKSLTRRVVGDDGIAAMDAGKKNYNKMDLLSKSADAAMDAGGKGSNVPVAKTAPGDEWKSLLKQHTAKLQKIAKSPQRRAQFDKFMAGISEVEEARSSASDQAAKAGAYNGGKSSNKKGNANLSSKLKGDALQKHRDASVAKMDAEDEAAKKAQRDRLNTEGDEALTLSFLSASLKNKMKPVKRNPVASHAQSSGSGTHQDQHNKNKPDRKQKHKKPIQADESIKSQLWAALNSK